MFSTPTSGVNINKIWREFLDFACGLGHGFGISIKDLILLCAKIENIGGFRTKVDKSRLRPVDVPILLCDYSKAREQIQYRPRIPLTKALQDNIQYFKDNPHLLGIERH